MRQSFLSYLTDDLDFAKQDCENAWEKAKKHFPSYDVKSSMQRDMLEIITRDILRGEFRPELAEVEIID